MERTPVLLDLGPLPSCSFQSWAKSRALRIDEPRQIRTEEFTSLMQAVAEGWNETDARKLADCFAEDAIYNEPSEEQL